MTIHVQCPACGARFQAADKFAGHRVKCAKCSTAITVGEGVPQASGPATPAEEKTPLIPVTCGCGKKLRVKAELAGKRVKCPACGAAVTVPGTHPAPAQPPDDFDLGQLAGLEDVPATTLGVPLSPVKKREQPSNTRLLIGLSAGGGAAVLVLVLIILFWPSGTDRELAQQPAASTGQASAAGETPPATPAAKPVDSATGRDQQPVRSQPTRSSRPRIYPSLPDALTELPPWIGSDAPFDVAKFLEAPPPDQNAATLYLDALFEFSSELSVCFGPVKKAPEGEVLRRAEIAQNRGQDLYRFEEAWQKNPASVDNRAVDAWLKGYEAGFEKLALAQQRPACAFLIEYRIDSLRPLVHACRSVARVVAWRTRRDVQLGDFDRPIQGVETVLRLSRDLRNKGEKTEQLVGISMDELYCCRQFIPEILLAPGLRREHCDRLLAVMARHEAEAPDLFLEVYRGDYLMTRNLLYDFQHGTGIFDKEHLKGLGPVDSPLTSIRQLVDCSFSGRLAKEKYGQAAGPGALGASAKLLELDRRLRAMTVADYANEAQALNRVYASILGLEGQSMLQRSRACSDPAIIEPLRDTWVVVFLEPDFIPAKVCLRYQAALRGTQCLVALRRWQLEHSQPPKDLDTVVKAAGMPGVPIDPYCDQPLRMTLLQGEPVVYSVGEDGKDDRAMADWRFGSQPGDLLFRLQRSN